MRGDTASVIFVIVIITILVVTATMIFWRWIAGQRGANEYSCGMKRMNYCLSLINKENVKWEDIPPKEGCEKFGIVKPSEEECKELVK